MSLEVILQGLVSGLLMGFVYALIAAGLSLIFGLMEIVNFAHGEFLMLAMFATFWAWALAKLDPLASLPITVGLLFLLGFAVYHGLIRWILGAPMLAQIFATFGLAIFLRAAAQALWGVDFKLVKNPLVDGRLAVGGLFIGLPQLAASAGALAAFGFLYWFITRTETGLALQATAQDRQAASLMGIDTQRMFALGWGIGAACVGAAGSLMTPFLPFVPSTGLFFTVTSFNIVIIGGMGSLLGAFVGGLLVGV
ncbi:MAG TPA: branched-chain amino acid ABC transporter permease, partial [Terriglobales bacterium]|nr:branched-chain amino acid ABC transporter permease [Terriglobales bacterium]